MSRAKTRNCGPFIPDPDLPPDHLGQGVCRTCHLVGRPGDAHHTLPAAPETDVQQLRAGKDGS